MSAGGTRGGTTASHRCGCGGGLGFEWWASSPLDYWRGGTTVRAPSFVMVNEGGGRAQGGRVSPNLLVQGGAWMAVAVWMSAVTWQGVSLTSGSDQG